MSVVRLLALAIDTAPFVHAQAPEINSAATTTFDGALGGDAELC
jgi:hypothetical protein